MALRGWLDFGGLLMAQGGRSGVYPLPPFYGNIDYGARVREAWGDEWLIKEVVYKFSNGRIFRDSTPNGGPYTGTAGNG